MIYAVYAIRLGQLLFEETPNLGRSWSVGHLHGLQQASYGEEEHAEHCRELNPTKSTTITRHAQFSESVPDHQANKNGFWHALHSKLAKLSSVVSIDSVDCEGTATLSIIRGE